MPPSAKQLTLFEPLRQQLLAAAEAFAPAHQPLSALLAALVDDVARATAEPLEIFPVCHHSPAAAVHLIQRLRSQPPRVIFMEMCEDLRGVVDKLRDCKLPVALQAFAGKTDAFPKSWAPLSLVAPLTEFSAEYQAIAFALENPATDLVFVDRSVDHVFQWTPQKEEALDEILGEEEELDTGADEDEEDAGPPPAHGAAVGVQMGNLEPTFKQFHDFLLKNAKVQSFAEWWDQYVEQVVIPADYASYRAVLCLVGSLIRRLGKRPEEHAINCKRESYMWTRMKEYLEAQKLKPTDAMYICGAAHAASEVPEYGTARPDRWEIPPRTKTPWLYGLIPSSYQAIDHQFRHPPGTVTLAEATWQKAQRALGLKPYTLVQKQAKTPAKGKAVAAPTPPPPAPAPTPPPAAPAPTDLVSYLTRPPRVTQEGEEQLLAWSVGIVGLAGKNGYLASPADSIAVYQTAILLAQLRNRQHPSPYDFRDAAVTCLEKDRTPKKRNIPRLCDILLGGDRRGQVGYTSLPPLAQDVYNRLAPLPIDLKSTATQRALLDLRQRPDLLPCSDLLWKIRFLLPNTSVAKPIMGEKALGRVPIQESWELKIGTYQGSLIELAYEGVTVEQVLEKRLRSRAFAADAKTPAALAAAEDAILYLDSPRLTAELGDHAIGLLVAETGGQSAPEIFARVRRLVHYFRSTPTGQPDWLQRFVATGYQHYATLLPGAFADRGTTPAEVAGMLAFVFTLESLALALGCQRSQLLIAVKQAGPVTDDPNKLGLLWAAEWLLQLRSADAIREFFRGQLENPLAAVAFPAYVNGFLLALQFTPLVARLVVELVTRAFGALPDRVLMPWLPGLLMMLRQHEATVLPLLLKEASACFPDDLAGLGKWVPPWEVPAPAPRPKTQAAPAAERGPVETAGWQLLRDQPATTEALAAMLGFTGGWGAAEAPAPAAADTSSPAEAGARHLLGTYPEAVQAMAGLVGGASP